MKGSSIKKMAALSSVQLKLNTLERFIQTNVNDDTMEMLHLVSEIRAGLQTLYLTNGMKSNFDYFKEINEINDTEIIENTELEKKLHEQLEERCHPLPVPHQNNFISTTDNTVQGYSSNDPIDNYQSAMDQQSNDPYLNVLDKINTLKDLMYKNTMDTSLFDYIDTFMKGVNTVIINKNHT